VVPMTWRWRMWMRETFELFWQNEERTLWSSQAVRLPLCRAMSRFGQMKLGGRA